jgi:hypothetical protein
MRSLRSGSVFRLQLIALVLLCAASVACGGDDDSPTSPSPAPGGSATLVIENITATSSAGGGGTFNYRASLRLRETGGASATITGVSVTLTQTSGVTVTQDVAPADAFPATTLAANGTLTSNPLNVSSVPIQASQVAVRITYTPAAGMTATVQATATVTAG